MAINQPDRLLMNWGTDVFYLFQTTNRTWEMFQVNTLKCLMGKVHREKILGQITQGARVLEWGMGGTTVWLAERLPPAATLTSIEHCPKWFYSVEKQIGKMQSVRLLLREPTGVVGRNATKEEENEKPLWSYIRAVNGEEFDVIIVDGYARSACLKEAKKMLSSKGVVFLHDSQRDWYDQAKSIFNELGNLGSCPDYQGPHLWWGI
jgi:tRNA A58 N-methylase Trm61